MRKFAKYCQKLAKYKVFRDKGFVVLLEIVAIFFLPKMQVFGNFVWSLKTKLIKHTRWEYVFVCLFYTKYHSLIYDPRILYVLQLITELSCMLDVARSSHTFFMDCCFCCCCCCCCCCFCCCFCCCCYHINSHNQVRGHKTCSSHSGVEEYPRETNTSKPKVVQAYITAETIHASAKNRYDRHFPAQLVRATCVL